MDNNNIKKVVLIAIGVIVVALFIIFDLDRFLTLEYIKHSQSQLQGIFSEHPVRVLSVYILIYIVVTALSLPGAAVLTLAGGALFGLVTGTIAASIASTTGATLACFVSRFILQDWVQNRFGDKLSAVNRGIVKEGGFYLFTLRLIPVFPFFVINLLMGLTKMPLRTFFWVSQLGMFPGTIVFVNAGKQLGQIDSAAGILSPSLIISFVILGLFPITVKKVIQIVRRKIFTEETEEVKNDAKV